MARCEAENIMIGLEPQGPWIPVGELEERLGVPMTSRVKSVIPVLQEKMDGEPYVPQRTIKRLLREEGVLSSDTNDDKSKNNRNGSERQVVCTDQMTYGTLIVVSLFTKVREKGYCTTEMIKEAAIKIEQAGETIFDAQDNGRNGKNMGHWSRVNSAGPQRSKRGPGRYSEENGKDD